jgi:hypothetical protein
MSNWSHKLQLAQERLEKAGDDPEILGTALVSFHGALEDYFREWLGNNNSVPVEQRQRVKDRKQVQWKELIDLMQEHGSLTKEARNKILAANGWRQEVAHGDRFRGSKADVVAYAQLVEKLTNTAISQTSTTTTPQLQKPAKNQQVIIYYQGNDVQVLKDRLVLGTKAYPMTQVTSAVMEVIQPPDKVEEIKGLFLLSVAIWLIVGIVTFSPSIGFLFFLVLMFLGIRKTLNLKPCYLAIIGIYGIPKEKLVSENKQHIENLVDAITTALIEQE